MPASPRASVSLAAVGREHYADGAAVLDNTLQKSGRAHIVKECVHRFECRRPFQRDDDGLRNGEQVVRQKARVGKGVRQCCQSLAVCRERVDCAVREHSGDVAVTRELSDDRRI